MAQQYLPPALMLEQLRNERYRQMAQGLQQGITGALQAYMNMEQLKQAAAEKKAERQEQARQFDARQRLREAELQSLRDLREGRLGVQQQKQALAEKKAADAQAMALDKQDLEQLRLTALGVDPGQRAVAGIDTKSAAELMSKGLADFGKRRKAVTPRPSYKTVTREEIMGRAPAAVADQPMTVRERYKPISYQQAFDALPAGTNELEKSQRLMDALMIGKAASEMRTPDFEEMQQATISPGSAQILDPLAATGEQATKRVKQLFGNLEQMVDLQQRKPELLAASELYRDSGGTRGLGEIAGAMQEKQEEMLKLEELQAKADAAKALAFKRRAAGRGRGTGRGGSQAGVKKEQIFAALQREADSRRATDVNGRRNAALKLRAQAREMLQLKKDKYDNYAVEPSQEDKEAAQKLIIQAQQLEGEADRASAAITEWLQTQESRYGLPTEKRATATYEQPDQSMMTAEQLAEIQNQPDLRARLLKAQPPKSLMEAKSEAAQIIERGDGTTEEELNLWLEKNQGSRKAKLIEQDILRYGAEGLSKDEAMALIGRDYLGKNPLQQSARKIMPPEIKNLLEGAQKL